MNVLYKVKHLQSHKGYLNSPILQFSMSFLRAFMIQPREWMFLWFRKFRQLGLIYLGLHLKAINSIFTRLGQKIEKKALNREMALLRYFFILKFFGSLEVVNGKVQIFYRILRSIRMHTSKLVNKPIQLEASSVQLLRRLKHDNRLSSIPRLTSKGGTYQISNNIPRVVTI